jgi:hypothetical protein
MLTIILIRWLEYCRDLLLIYHWQMNGLFHSCRTHEEKMTRSPFLQFRNYASIRRVSSNEVTSKTLKLPLPTKTEALFQSHQQNL